MQRMKRQPQQLARAKGYGDAVRLWGNGKILTLGNLNKVILCVCGISFIIPALWETEVGGSLEPRSSRPSGATYQGHFSTKKFKNIR